MPEISSFAQHTMEYDDWYDDMPHVFDAEKRAVRCLLPARCANILEVGVGTGRFASSLGVRIGVDPCPEMLEMACARGIDGVIATAEKLPFSTGKFDSLLMVTVLCFLDDPLVALRESKRVLRTGGRMVMGFIDRLSVMGENYKRNQTTSTFFRDAKFYNVDDVTAMLTAAGFEKLTFVQTLMNPIAKINESEPVLAGTGKGSFVVVAAE